MLAMINVWNPMEVIPSAAVTLEYGIKRSRTLILDFHPSFQGTIKIKSQAMLTGKTAVLFVSLLRSAHA